VGPLAVAGIGEAICRVFDVAPCGTDTCRHVARGPNPGDKFVPSVQHLDGCNGRNMEPSVSNGRAAAPLLSVPEIRETASFWWVGSPFEEPRFETAEMSNLIAFPDAERQ